MSILKVNSIEPANAGSEDYFLARAWVNFNQVGTQSIYADGNCSSITDVAVGISDIAFTNVMSSTTYAVTTVSTEYTANSNGRVHAVVRGSVSGGSTQTTTGFGIANHNTATAGSLYDFANSYAVVIE